MADRDPGFDGAGGAGGAAPIDADDSYTKSARGEPFYSGPTDTESMWSRFTKTDPLSTATISADPMRSVGEAGASAAPAIAEGAANAAQGLAKDAAGVGQALRATPEAAQQSAAGAAAPEIEQWTGNAPPPPSDVPEAKFSPPAAPPAPAQPPMNLWENFWHHSEMGAWGTDGGDRQNALASSIADTISQVKALKGEVIPNPFLGGYRDEAAKNLGYDPFTLAIDKVGGAIPNLMNSSLSTVGTFGSPLMQEQFRLYQNHLNEIAAANPDNPALLAAVHAGLNANDYADAYIKSQSDKYQAEYAKSGGYFLPWLAATAGEIWGSTISDPINRIGLMVGGGGAATARSAIGRIAEQAVKQGAIQAGLTGVQEPGREERRRELGQPTGFLPVLYDEVGSFLMGGIPAGVIHGIGEGWMAWHGLTPVGEFVKRAGETPPPGGWPKTEQQRNWRDEIDEFIRKSDAGWTYDNKTDQWTPPAGGGGGGMLALPAPGKVGGETPPAPTTVTPSGVHSAELDAAAAPPVHPDHAPGDVLTNYEGHVRHGQNPDEIAPPLPPVHTPDAPPSPIQPDNAPSGGAVTRTSGYDGPHADAIQNRISFLRQAISAGNLSPEEARDYEQRASDFQKYADARDAAMATAGLPEDKQGAIRALRPGDVVTGQDAGGRTHTGEISGWDSRGSAVVYDHLGFSRDVLPETISDIRPGERQSGGGAGGSVQTDSVTGRPVHVNETFDPLALKTDAVAYQYKGGGDENGVTSRLKGAAWDPMATGKIVVHERHDGSLYVADGHQRTGLAKDLHAQGQLPPGTRVMGDRLREADGWTVEDARARAAKKNLQEGGPGADVIDVARILRDHPEIWDKSLPVSDPKLKQGKGLAELSDEAWRMVLNGQVKPNFAAIVGLGVADKTKQAAVMADMVKFKPSDENAARMIVADANAAGFKEDTFEDMFGSHSATRTLAGERAQVFSRVMALLRDNKRIFRMLDNEQSRIEAAGNVLAGSNAAIADRAERLGLILEKLATRHGPVSAALNKAAGNVADGMEPMAAARLFLEDIERLIREEGLKLDGAPPIVPAPRTDIDTGTPQGQAQQTAELEAAEARRKAKEEAEAAATAQAAAPVEPQSAPHPVAEAAHGLVEQVTGALDASGTPADQIASGLIKAAEPVIDELFPPQAAAPTEATETPAPVTEHTEAGGQTLLPGMKPVTDKEKAETAAGKPLKGGAAPLPEDGLFGGGLPPDMPGLLTPAPAENPAVDIAALAKALRARGVHRYNLTGKVPEDLEPAIKAEFDRLDQEEAVKAEADRLAARAEVTVDKATADAIRNLPEGWHVAFDPDKGQVSTWEKVENRYERRETFRTVPQGSPNSAPVVLEEGVQGLAPSPLNHLRHFVRVLSPESAALPPGLPDLTDKGLELHHFADLAARGLKPKRRGDGVDPNGAALVTWAVAQDTGKPARSVLTVYGWKIDKGAPVYGTPQIVVTPEGMAGFYQVPKLAGEPKEGTRDHFAAQLRDSLNTRPGVKGPDGNWYLISGSADGRHGEVSRRPDGSPRYFPVGGDILTVDEAIEAATRAAFGEPAPPLAGLPPAKVETPAPGRQRPFPLEDEVGKHPIVKAMNEAIRWVNGLSEEDYRYLSLPTLPDLAAQISNTMEPEKLLAQWKGDIARRGVESTQIWDGENWVGRPEETAPPAPPPGAPNEPQEPQGNGTKAEAGAEEPGAQEQPGEGFGSDYGADNAFFKKDRYEQLKARFKQKLKDAAATMSAGFDPELLQIGMEMAGFHIEAGARTFAKFVKAIVRDLDSSVAELRPYLRGMYNGARDIMEDGGLDVAGMDRPDKVDAEFARILAEEAPKAPPTSVERPAIEAPKPEVSKAETAFANKFKTKAFLKAMEEAGFAMIPAPGGAGRYTVLEHRGGGHSVAFDPQAAVDNPKLSVDLRRWLGYPDGESPGVNVTPPENGGWTLEQAAEAAVADAFPKTPAVGQESARDAFVAAIKARLASGEQPFKSIVEARQIAKGLGLEIPEGTSANKLVDELVERAVVEHARDIVETDRTAGAAPAETFGKLLKVYEGQPNLSTRTSTSIAEQAYSTPVPLAYVASRLAGIGPDTRVLEPTAGNGMLLIEANPQHAVTNELNPTRAAALEAQGFHPTTTDATSESLFADRAGQMDAVIANPPFGTVKEGGEKRIWSVDGFRTDQVDHAIALNALKTMKSGGRAVLIVGGVKADDPAERAAGYMAKAKRRFYYQLLNNYKVSDIFTVAGDLYQKQGAGWPVDVIVIEGRGKSERDPLTKTPPPLLKTWEEVGGKLNGVPTEDVTGAVGTDSETGASPPETEQRPEGGDGVGGEAPVGGAPVEPLGGTGPGEPGQVGGAGDHGQPGNGVGKPAMAPGAGGGPQQGGNVRGANPAPHSERRGSVGTSVEGQTPYEPASTQGVKLNTLLPANLREATYNSLDRLQEEHGSIDAYVARALGRNVADLGKYFSGEQVDAIGLGISNIERGEGFIIGDQTGLGKGRVVAAMISYAKTHGMIPVFVTEKPDLYGDMWRDLHDIGWHEQLGRPINMAMTNSGTRIPLDDEALDWLTDRDDARENGQPEPPRRGSFSASQSSNKAGEVMSGILSGSATPDVVFTTYDQMNSVKGNETPRRNFLRQVAPRSFLIMDEAHNAGGAANPSAGWEDDEKAPPRSEVFREVVGAARAVMYSSATYAKSPNVMTLYSRTDMLKAVDDVSKLPDLIGKGGVPLQQIVASMLADAGQYMRRERSFEGINYDYEGIPVSEQAYSEFSDGLRSIFQFDREFEEERLEIAQELAAEMGGGTTHDGGVGEASVDATSFASVMHNIISQMVMALKAQKTGERAVEALLAGEKPVIALSKTNDAFIKDFADNEGIKIGDEINIGFVDILKRYLERTRRVTIKSGDDEKIRVMIPLHMMSAHALDMYHAAEDLLDSIDLGDLPVSPLDTIRNVIEKAGYSIREITGRSAMVDYSRPRETVDDLERQGYSVAAPVHESHPFPTALVHGENRRDWQMYAPDQTDEPALRGASLEDMMAQHNAGRGTFLVRRPSSETGSAGKKQTVKMFNDGRLDAVLGNKSMSTGLSMHPSIKFKDRRPRRMIIGEADPDINTHMQMLGRINRTGQVTLPRYTHLAAEIPAETRPTAILMRKMASLNANTTGAAKGKFTADAVDFLNRYGDRAVAAILRDDPDLWTLLGEPGIEDNIAGLAAKATGRLTLLHPEQQQEFIDRITAAYKAVIEAMDAAGTNDLEAKSLDLQARTIDSTEIKPATGPSPFQGPVNLEKVSVKAQGRAMRPDEVTTAIADHLGETPTKRPFAMELRALEKSGGKKQAAMIARVRTEAQEHIRQVVAATKDPDAKTRARAKLEDAFASLETLSDVARPGATVTLTVKGEDMPAVVIGLTRDAKVKNPVALSAWNALFALPNSSRSLSIPLSRLIIAGGKEREDSVTIASNPNLRADDLGPMFEAANKDGREDRYMVTGNLLAGYEQLAGQIVTHTMEGGQTRPAILLGRMFDAKEFMKERAVNFVDGDHLIKFLDAVPDAEVWSVDGALMVKKSGPRYAFEALRREGRKYYADGVVRGVYDNWQLSGQKMKATVGAQTATDLIDALRQVGAVFHTRSDQDVAESLRPAPPAPAASAAKPAEAGGNPLLRMVPDGEGNIVDRDTLVNSVPHESILAKIIGECED